MLAINTHLQHVQRVRAQEQRLLKKRRRQLLIATTRAARALRQLW